MRREERQRSHYVLRSLISNCSSRSDLQEDCMHNPKAERSRKGNASGGRVERINMPGYGESGR